MQRLHYSKDTILENTWLKSIKYFWNNFMLFINLTRLWLQIEVFFNYVIRKRK